VGQPVNISSSNNGSAVEKVMIYSAKLADNKITATQKYTFNSQKQALSFAGVNFTVSPNAVKWSIYLANSATTNNATSGGLQFLYTISIKSTTNGSGYEHEAAPTVEQFANQPQPNITTYWLVSGSGTSTGSSVAKVQMLDVALVDGIELVPVSHSISPINRSSSSSGAVSFNLEVSLPAFSKSVEYDPTISLGVLVKTGQSSSRKDSFLIEEATIAAGGGLVFVLVVVITILVVHIARVRRMKRVTKVLHAHLQG